LIWLSLLSCQSSPEQQTQVPEVLSQAESPFPEILQKVWEAHGGLQKWRQMNTLAFTLHQASLPVNQQLVDLNSGKVLIRNGEVRVGYDGNEVWHIDNPSSHLLLENHQAFHYGHYFFVTMPFLLSDDDVGQQLIGQQRIGGKLYVALEVDFRNHTEFPSREKFLMLLDPATHQMTWMLKKINTEVDNDLYSARLYKNWQWVNGLLLPLQCEKYTWQNERLGEIQEVWEYLDLSIEILPSDQSMFLRPADAQVLDYAP